MVLGEAGVESDLLHAALSVDLRQDHPLTGVQRNLFSRLAVFGQNELGDEVRVGDLLFQELSLVAAARALQQQNRGVLSNRFPSARLTRNELEGALHAAHQLEERLLALARPVLGVNHGAAVDENRAPGIREREIQLARLRVPAQELHDVGDGELPDRALKLDVGMGLGHRGQAITPKFPAPKAPVAGLSLAPGRGL
jgi:hypothetical protein